MTNKKGNFKKGGNLPESNMRETIKTITETPINNLTSINSEYLEEDKYSGLKRFLFWFFVILFVALISGYLLNKYFDINLIEKIQETFNNIKNFFNNLTKIKPDNNKEKPEDDKEKPEDDKEKTEDDKEKTEDDKEKSKSQSSLKELKNNLDNKYNIIAKNIDDYQDKNFDNSLEKELVNKKIFNYKDSKTKLSDNETTPEPVSNTTTGSGFCYIGSSNDTRFCAPVTNKNKCMSGEIFPSIDLCINPNIRKGY